MGLGQSLVWQNAYGGPNDDAGYAISITHDSSFIVAGYTTSFGAGAGDVFLLKINSNGDTLWTRTFGGSSTDVGWSVDATTDRGFIIAGETQSFGYGGSDIYVIRTDSVGNILWSRTFGGTRDDAGRAIKQTSDGGYIIAGHINDSAGVGGSVFVLRLSPQGDSLWSRAIMPQGSSKAFSVVQTLDGGYVVAGSVVFGLPVGYIVRLNQSGDSLWSRTISGGDGASLSEVQLTSDGGFVTVGSSAFPYWYLTVTKWTSQGTMQWSRLYPSPLSPPSDARGRGIKQLADGGYIVCGIASTFTPTSKVFVLRLTSQGDTLWTKVFGTGNLNHGNSIVAPQTTEYLIAGSTTSFGSGGFDVYVLRLSTITGVQDDSGEPVPTSSHLRQNYPNPFNSSTVIEFALPKRVFVDLRVFDVLGREIAILVHGERLAGSHRIQWHAGNLPSGLYLCKLRAGEFLQTRKILLLR